MENNQQRQLAPIILFVYNRPWHTRETVQSLQRNPLAKFSQLIIFSDGYKGEKDEDAVLEVRDYIHTIEGFSEIKIVEREHNLGLANSVIKGATEIIEQYGKIIVLEDDLILAPNFLDFMNDGLEFYKTKDNIWTIGGYTPEIQFPSAYKKGHYLSYRVCSWGWATWKDRWDTVDWGIDYYENLKKNYRKRRAFNIGGNDLYRMLIAQKNREIDSWAIRWHYSSFIQRMYTVLPINTMVQNIGMDGSGTHCSSTNKFNNDSGIITNECNYSFDTEIEINKEIANLTRSFYNLTCIKYIWSKIEYGLDYLGLQSIRKTIISYSKRIKKH